ncbi:ABC transporter ATP-binding protein [Albimonas pacifica]|uniref:ATP-binding cassette, subfamily B n=1 Tax=Albimonas pacifica TaxID=1114924 RepID=A0A1I3BUN4_9RHOB|nr:ABC transporter ATP-binding protein [Albimonas pacifica]SFH65796.1 ATP-binding cassette, subfamily B [Albimonas pacifica]
MLTALTRRTAGLFDPNAPAAGSPPQEFLAFCRWALSGAFPVFFAAIAANVALAWAEVGVSWAVSWLVDVVAEAGPSLTEPGARAAFLAERGWEVALLAVFIFAARPLCMAVSSALMQFSIQPGMFQQTVFRLHRHTLGQAMSYFEDDYAGRISAKQLQTGNALTELASEVVQAVAFALATMLAALAALGAADWRLTLGLLGWLAVYLAWIAWMLPRLRAKARARADAQSGLSGQLVDTISHMETVKLFAHAGREETHAREALERLRRAKLDFGRTAWVYRVVIAVLAGALPVALVGTALWLWAGGSGSPGAVALSGLLSLRIGQMSGWISFTAMGMFANAGVVEDGIRTLTPPHRMRDAPDAAPMARAEGRLTFEGVTFKYGQERERAGGGLTGFSLDVTPGEKVALVGRSGAGKSTAMKLALRLYDPEAGRILLDGRDIRTLDQDALRRQIAFVTQDTAMFNRSAMENILYGRPDAGVEEAMEAARMAAAHEFIEELEDFRGRVGYEARLGERGVKLSGGQRQRVAIARAILKDAPILMLDEATSALDSETEAEVQAALERLMQGRTVVAIAHRLSTIASMDRIVVMDEGRIAEEGPHDVLLKRGGIYAELWGRQSGGFMGLDAAE